MKRIIFVVSVLFVLVYFNNGFAGVVVFPVDGLLGDSYYPRDSSGDSCNDNNPIGSRKNYTTLWSGKYLGCFQDRNKGSGGHPGMDIAGTTGDKIYAITDGRVVYADCNTSWGKLIVIEHLSSQFNESSMYNYYSVYAHLREIYVSVNDIVDVGDKIGLMGGATSDPCHGDSTGRHLHFQIEKQINWESPYWPTSGANSIDPDININTVDPIAFIESHYAYFVGKSESYGWKFVDTIDSFFWSEPFADCHNYNGGVEALGVPINNVHLSTSFSGYSSSGSPAVYIQDLNKDGHTYTLALNTYVANSNYSNRLGVAYPVHGAVRVIWMNNYQYLGPPVSNEYYYYINETCTPENQRVVQWFEPSDNNYVCVVYNPNTLSSIFGSSTETGIPFDQTVLDQHKLINISGGTGGGLNVYPPSSLTLTNVTTSSISLAWNQGANTNSPDSYKVYRSNGSYLGSTSSTVYADNGLSDNTLYGYYITTVIDGVESGSSSVINATTQEIIVPVAEVNIINQAITTTITDNLPVDPAYSYTFGLVSDNEIYAWAEVEIDNITIGDVDWLFRNAEGGSVVKGTTTRVSLGVNRYYIYAKAYATNTSCDGAFGTWEAKLRTSDGHFPLKVNFSMSIKSITIVSVQEVTPEYVKIYWSAVECDNHYVIYRNGQPLVEIEDLDGTSNRTFIDSTIESGSSYIYQVAAKHIGENGTFQSEFKASSLVEIPYPEPEPEPEPPTPPEGAPLPPDGLTILQ